MNMRFPFALLLSAPSVALALSAGSPDCNFTQHGFPPTAGSGGYALTLPSGYSGGQQLTVTLTGVTQFKGLLLFGFDPGNVHVGSWQFPAGFRGVPSCDGSDTNTLTHTNATSKSAPLSFTW